MARHEVLASPVLVGRERELASLIEAASAPPSLVAVEGQAGIGKTRLITELLEHPAVSRHHRLIGHCQPLREPFPLGPIVQAVRGLAEEVRHLSLTPLTGALRPLLPEIADHLPPSPAPLGDPLEERHRVFRAIRELLDAAGPTLCVLEDLHWADERTGEFLRFLASDPPGRLSLVLTYRSEPATPLAGLWARSGQGLTSRRMELRPLDVEEVRELVRAILELDTVTEPFAAFLHERTSGIPFAVEEVLRLLRDRRDLVRQGGWWARRALDDISVPPAIRESIRERVAALPPDARGMIDAAAVLGVPASEGALSKVAALPPGRASNGLVSALGSGLLEEPRSGLYSFHHVLAREAVEEGIPGPRRRRLHFRAVGVAESEKPKPVTRLAHHAREAGLTSKWIRYAEAAASRSIEVGHDSEAFHLLAALLREPVLPTGRRFSVALKCGLAAIHGRLHQQAIPLLREEVARPELPPGQRGELRRVLGTLLNHADDNEAAYEQYALAVHDLRRRPVAAANATSGLAIVGVMVRGHPAEHIASMESALRTAIRHGADAGLVAELRGDLAALMVSGGDPRAWRVAAGLPRPGGSVEQRRERIRTCRNIARAAVFVGHDRRASALLAEGLELSGEEAYDRRLEALRATEILLQWLAGAWEGLGSRAREAAEAARDAPSGRLLPGLVLGLLAVAEGKQNEAAELLEGVKAEAERVRALPEIGMAAGGLARIELGHGRPVEAVARVQSALRLVTELELWAWVGPGLVPDAAASFVAAGRIDEARELVARYARGITGLDAPAARASLSSCRALVEEADGNLAGAADWFRRAGSSWLRLPRPYEAARAMERRAGVLLAAGQDAGSDALFGALGTYTSLGADEDSARARRGLREHGHRIDHDGDRRGYGDQLSPREIEVVDLVARGMTDKEIAGQLFLSPRTVGHHVSRAMRKLGVSRRPALVAALTQGSGID